MSSENVQWNMIHPTVIYFTVKFLKIRTAEKFAVFTLKFEQGGFTIE